MQPATIRIENDGQRIAIVLADGALVRLEAGVLWCACPSAVRRRRRLSGLDQSAPAGIAVLRATPVGNYALNLAFSDGHDRGVYPWSLLRELASRPTLADFLIPAAGTAVPASNPAF
ncbi:MAG: gamma-butyrobetaine hydroxylase-like domain-containing protein [Hyphomicrobiaceae bacterium]|nr:gamma-butyrobetaine hydroxylase-like domain-containing protein [Hyphomicrobiaceae bacterium]